MNGYEMRIRLVNGEDPLELSIEKWDDIAYSGGEDRGPDNCALCDIYYRHGKEHNICGGCPVKERTGKIECDGTPYKIWVRHFREEHLHSGSCSIQCGECRVFAIAELEFLKSLRETK